MSVPTISILDITPLQENWDASLQSLIISVRNSCFTLKLSIVVQGSHTIPSTIQVQLQDTEGNNVLKLFYARIRVVDNNGYTNATHATIAPVIGAGLEVFTVNKDFIMGSDNNGVMQIQCTDTTAEAFQVLFGSPDFQAPFLDSNNSITVVHA